MSEMFSNDKLNELRYQSRKDPVLKAVLDLAFGRNDEGGAEASIPLTLTVNGQVILGQAVTFMAWIEGTQEQLQGPGAEAFSEQLGHLADEVAAAEAHHRAKDATAIEDNVIPRGRTHVHMKDARFSGLMLDDPRWLRISLNAVDAWSVGS